MLDDFAQLQAVFWACLGNEGKLGILDAFFYLWYFQLIMILSGHNPPYVEKPLFSDKTNTYLENPKDYLTKKNCTTDKWVQSCRTQNQQKTINHMWRLKFKYHLKSLKNAVVTYKCNKTFIGSKHAENSKKVMKEIKPLSRHTIFMDWKTQFTLGVVVHDYNPSY
jgi:hypothetical protein